MSKTPTRARDDRPIDPADLGQVFTVHLRGDAGDTDRLRGRVTHAATGDATHFDSADELLAVLRDARR